MLLKLFRAASALACLTVSTPLLAQTATSDFKARITIVKECQIASSQDLDFGTNGVLTEELTATSTISLVCSSGTPYTVGLGAGLSADATVTNRHMIGPDNALISYGLFRDAGFNSNWGNTPGTDTYGGTGTGTTEVLTVYGRVPPQTTPVAGDYSDTVAVTVSY